MQLASPFSVSLTATDPSGLPVAEACFSESSACQVTASYFDTNGDPLTPAAVSYRIDDLTSGEPIVVWTSITPATTNTIVVTSAQNALISLTRSFEEHQLTLQVTDASGNVVYAPASWLLKRIFPFVPGWSAGSGDTQESSD